MAKRDPKRDPTMELSSSQLVPDQIARRPPAPKPIPKHDASVWKQVVVGTEDFAPPRRSTGSGRRWAIAGLAVAALGGGGFVAWRELRGDGASGTGTSAAGTSGTGTSAAGTSAAGTSGTGTSAAGTSAVGTSGGGTSGSETAAGGASASGTSGSGSAGNPGSGSAAITGSSSGEPGSAETDEPGLNWLGELITTGWPPPDSVAAAFVELAVTAIAPQKPAAAPKKRPAVVTKKPATPPPKRPRK